MRLLVLDTTSKTIELALLGAPATNQPHFVSTWADSDGSTFVEGSEDGVLNGVTDVTAVSSPASGVRRVIKSMAVYNDDTADVTLLVKYDNGTSQRTLIAVTLEPGDVWTLDGVFDSNGALKKAVAPINWGDIDGLLSDQNDLQDELDFRKLFLTSIDDTDSPFAAPTDTIITTILADTTSNPITVTLSPAANVEGIYITVKKIDGIANNVTIDPDGVETIDGAATHTLSNQFDSITVVSNGSNWFIVGEVI